MISVVLYGRNDSYGYNLHKRAALSLNCIAELLTHETDEILFVDYNTPDDFPTFPEAIQDTLTPRAKQLLRILRVRARHHERFKALTHLVALEPVARNVAIRRSNSANRWILSTNTDMIFVPRNGRSLSQIAAAAHDGFYHLPRFEIPESLWELLDRTDPSGTLARVGDWGRSFHLNEVVHAHDPWVKYDAPGDFQLVLRADLFRIGGFNEEMLLGWHLDSNIARRLNLVHGETGDLCDELFGYHCDHTRQVTPMHRWGSAQNDLVRFNEAVSRPDVPEQADNWGLAGETIEELTAGHTSALYLDGLVAAITRDMSAPTHVAYSGTSFDKVDYDVPHVLPFIADILASYPRESRIGWFGTRYELLEAFASAVRSMGFSENVLVARGAAWLGETLPGACQWTEVAAVTDCADVLVFDCGLLPPRATDEERRVASVFIARCFRRAVRTEEQRSRDSGALRRFIAVNAINNRFEGLISSRVNAARSPMASRIRQGFVVVRPERNAPIDLLPRLSTGPAARRDGTSIATLPGQTGFVFFGPYLSLDAGYYRLSLSFSPCETGVDGAAILDLYANPYTIGSRSITRADVGRGVVIVDFAVTDTFIDRVPWVSLEFRLNSDGNLPFVLKSATLEPVAEPTNAALDYELLPMMTAGPATSGRVTLRRLFGKLMERISPVFRSAAAVRVRSGHAGFVLYGPYLTLPPGRYEATFTLRCDDSRQASRGDAVLLEVVNGEGAVQLAHRRVALPTHGAVEHRLEFEIHSEAEAADIEFRVQTDGSISFSVLRVSARHLPEEPASAALAVAGR